MSAACVQLGEGVAGRGVVRVEVEAVAQRDTRVIDMTE
jgi:hypothetical protein